MVIVVLIDNLRMWADTRLSPELKAASSVNGRHIGSKNVNARRQWVKHFHGDPIRSRRVGRRLAVQSAIGIVQPLAEGGMAELWLAHHVRSGAAEGARARVPSR